MSNFLFQHRYSHTLSLSLFITGGLFSSAAFSVLSPLPAPLNTQNNSQNSPFILQAHHKNLALSQGWLRLLYYPENITATDKKFHSRVQSSTFFVSKNGATDPQAELDATIAALFNENAQNTDLNTAVQCRFPARTHWLKQQLGINDDQLPTIACPQMQSWLQQVNPSSASLIFAEEYLDNPASMFGHSFLRLDNATTQQAFILNYMPKSLPQESFVKSSYKSLIAGNMGEFTVEPYEQKIQQYRDKEGRDIWRYKLKLSNAEQAQLARQIWEIKDQNLTYYLSTDNCASEILVLLNTLRPDKNYLANFHHIVTPADLVRELQRQGVLATAEFEPAIKTQKQALLNHKNDNASLVTNTPNTIFSNTILPNNPSNIAPSDNNPQFAHGLGRLSIGIGQQQRNFNTAKASHSEKQNFTELGYRLVYHDALDPRSGYPAGFSLEALSFKLRANQKNDHAMFDNANIELQDFTLIKTRSLKPINTARNGKSWGANISALQQSDGSKQHLVGNFGGEYGWSVAYGTPKVGSGDIPPNLCYALGTGTAQVGNGLEKGYRIGGGANVGCATQFSGKLRGMAELSLPFWYQANRKGDDGYWQPAATLGVQYDLNQHNALRLNSQYVWQNNAQSTSVNSPYTPLPKIKHSQEVGLQYLHYF